MLFLSAVGDEHQPAPAFHSLGTAGAEAPHAMTEQPVGESEQPGRLSPIAEGTDENQAGYLAGGHLLFASDGSLPHVALVCRAAAALVWRPHAVVVRDAPGFSLCVLCGARAHRGTLGRLFLPARGASPARVGRGALRRRV